MLSALPSPGRSPMSTHTTLAPTSSATWSSTATRPKRTKKGVPTVRPRSFRASSRSPRIVSALASTAVELRPSARKTWTSGLGAHRSFTARAPSSLSWRPRSGRVRNWFFSAHLVWTVKSPSLSMSSPGTSRNTASRALAWSARRVSMVRVFSRGPARPTPMRAVVFFFIRARASASWGWSSMVMSRQAFAVMSRQASHAPVSPLPAASPASSRAMTSSTIRAISFSSSMGSPPSGKYGGIAGPVGKPPVGHDPHALQPPLEGTDGAQVQDLSYGVGVVIGVGLVVEHHIVAGWHPQDVVDPGGGQQQREVLDVVLVGHHVVGVAAVAAHGDAGELAHEVVLQPRPDHLAAVVEVLRADEAHHRVHHEGVEGLGEAVAPGLH